MNVKILPLFLVIAVIAAAGCVGQSGTQTGTGTPGGSAAMTYNTFSDGVFSTEYPDWPADPQATPEKIISVTDGRTCIYSLTNGTVPGGNLSAFMSMAKQEFENENSTVTLEHASDTRGLITVSSAPIEIKFYFMSCGDVAYSIALFCGNGVIPEGLMDKVLASRCL